MHHLSVYLHLVIWFALAFIEILRALVRLTSIGAIARHNGPRYGLPFSEPGLCGACQRSVRD
jgi:hypothetical protein